jgi:hypothetical protein
MAEYGYACCASKNSLLEILNQPEIKRELTEDQVARILAMMARTHRYDTSSIKRFCLPSFTIL